MSLKKTIFNTTYYLFHKSSYYLFFTEYLDFLLSLDVINQNKYDEYQELFNHTDTVNLGINKIKHYYGNHIDDLEMTFEINGDIVINYKNKKTTLDFHLFIRRIMHNGELNKFVMWGDKSMHFSFSIPISKILPECAQEFKKILHI